MDTAIISAATTGGEASRACGCVGSGVGIRRCEEADALWVELLVARDAMRAGERTVGRRGRGHKTRLDGFAAARDSYHAHVRVGGGS